MTVEMEYEDFVKGAFSLYSRRDVGRNGDPARFADTDHFGQGSISTSKIGTGYAMGIFNRIIESNKVVNANALIQLIPQMEKFGPSLF